MHSGYFSQSTVYVHYAAHTLNLCVVSACSIQMVKNMMGTMVEICLFFSNSPKRQNELEKRIEASSASTKASELVQNEMGSKGGCF